MNKAQNKLMKMLSLRAQFNLVNSENVSKADSIPSRAPASLLSLCAYRLMYLKKKKKFISDFSRNNNALKRMQYIYFWIPAEVLSAMKS